jgi:cell division protein FtsW
MAKTSATGKKEWLLGWESRLLVLITAVLVVFGLASVYAASSSLVERGRVIGATRVLDQIIGALVGALLLLLASRLNLDRLRAQAWPIIGVTALLLLILLLPFTRAIAPRINGARRWIDIGISIQVSEIAKLAVVIWTAMLCAKKGTEVRRLTKGLLPVLVIVAPLALMIALEPDLSVAVSVMFIAMLVLFAGGARIGHFILLAVMALPWVWNQIERVQYQLLRMTAFLDAVGGARLSDNYQIDQSLIGVGSGGLTGVGFGHGLQRLGFLPYPYSDFIFSTIAEERGFIGVLFLVTMYSLYIWLALRLAKVSSDPFRQLLGVGCAVMVGTDAFLHMAVGVGIVPTTGLVLPFISYGRSGLITAMIATGLLINLGTRKRQVVA